MSFCPSKEKKCVPLLLREDAECGKAIIAVDVPLLSSGWSAQFGYIMWELEYLNTLLALADVGNWILSIIHLCCRSSKHMLARETQNWRRLFAASSSGGIRLSLCLEQGEPLLYVLALTYVHVDSRRRQWEAGNNYTRSQRKQRRADVAGAWRMRGGKELGCRVWTGKLWMFLVQWQSFTILTD